jgi:protein TonB
MFTSSVRPFHRLASAAAAAIALAAAPRLAAAQEEVYGGGDLSSPPKLLSAAATARLVARSFPEEMRKAGSGGTVQLQFVIGRDGKVEPGSVEVLQTPAPALGEAAKGVAEKMQFVPGKKDGSAVRARVQLPIIYKP